MTKMLKMRRQTALRLLDELRQQAVEISQLKQDSPTAVEAATESMKKWVKRANRRIAEIASEEFDLLHRDVYVLRSTGNWLEGIITLPSFQEDCELLVSSIDRYRERITNSNEYEEPVYERVFIIHGHGDRSPVEQAIRDLGLEPVVLVDEPGGTLSIIEKFERDAQTVDYAVALFTPDDRGWAKIKGPQSEHDRPRQNVIIETGFFLSALGRERVCILVAESVDLAEMSDLRGVSTIAYGENTNWRGALEKELEKAQVITNHFNQTTAGYRVLQAVEATKAFEGGVPITGAARNQHRYSLGVFIDDFQDMNSEGIKESTGKWALLADSQDGWRRYNEYVRPVVEDLNTSMGIRGGSIDMRRFEALRSLCRAIEEGVRSIDAGLQPPPVIDIIPTIGIERVVNAKDDRITRIESAYRRVYQAWQAWRNIALLD